MAAAAVLPALHDTGSEGTPVLFLHAFPLDASQWDHQVAALSGEHRCLRVDLWGCGASPPPPDAPASLDAFAGDVLRVLDAGEVDSFSVAGLSMGGYLAFALWRAAPARMRALVLCNTRAAADGDATRGERLAIAERALGEQSVEFLVEPMVERLIGPAARAEPHIVDPLRGRVRRCAPAGIAYAQRAMAARPDSTALLAQIDVPTLVVSGAHDAVVAPDEARAMAGRIAGSRHVELDCGHLSNLELPHRFSEVVGEFLGSLPVRA